MKNSTIPLICLGTFFAVTAQLFFLIGLFTSFSLNLKPAFLPGLLPMFDWNISLRTLILADVLGIGIDIYFILVNEKG